MLAFIAIFFFVVIPIVIVGAIVYGIHKIITGIIKRRKFAKRFENPNRANQQRENSRAENPTGEYYQQRENSRAEVYDELGIAYHSLGLSITATIEQAHQKYRELAKEFHPDVNPHPQAAQKFMKIKHAYETIRKLSQQVA